MRLMGFLIAAQFALTAPTHANPDSVTTKKTDAQGRKAGISASELSTILSSNLLSSFVSPPALAFSPSDGKFWSDKAKEAHRAAPVLRGDAAQNYDVIIQIGHYPRTKGRTGGQGKYVNEQQMAALVSVGIVQQLASAKVNGKPISALLIGADDFTKGLKSRIFLALHTDSAARPCSVGPSVGYQKVGDAKGMHGIALALAITLDISPSKFMADNYTEGLKNYYSYSQFKTTDFIGLLEMSELTCPAQEEALLTRAAVLSKNLATAIEFALR